MRTTGLKSIFFTLGLLVAGAGQAAPQAVTPPPAAAPVTVTPVAPAAGTAAPSVAATPAATTPADPTLAADGTPLLRATAGVGQPVDGHYGIQPQVTPNGRWAHWFHDIILFPVITIISLLVLGLILWVIFRYRRAANPVASKTSHNTMIEIVWTLAPVIILVLIAVPSIGLLRAQFKPPPANAITLKAIGNQWYWTYQYPDHGGFEVTANMLKEQADVRPGERFRTDADGPRLLAADNRVVLPVGVPIRLITTANDVIHSWAVPAFWLKLDAVPGRLNETSFTIDKPGLYFGQCSELCGARHAFMPIAVEAVSPARFAAWVVAKGGKMPGAATPSAAMPAPATAGTASVTAPPVTQPAVTQGATANPAGAGNVDQ